MRVYQLVADIDHYQGLNIAEGGLHDFAARFDEGKPLRGKVKKPRLVPFLEELPKGDFPSLSGNAPVFSPRAVEALHDMLAPNGELFSVDCDNDEYFIYNVTHLVDALDEPNSRVARFHDDGRIFHIYTYSFHAKRLRNETIFKLTQFRSGTPYVTQPFVERAESAGLKGFYFRLVWSDDGSRHVPLYAR